MLRGGRLIGRIRGFRKAVPIRAPVRLGTIDEKAIRIRAVSSLILVFHPSLIIHHPLYYVKMLRFLRRVCRIW